MFHDVERRAHDAFVLAERIGPGGRHVDAIEGRDHPEFPVDRTFHTLAGFALSHIKELPEVGAVFDALGWRFEIVDMDGRRIDKVLAYRPPVLHRLKTADE
ncbi:MAG: hypothetical protein B7Z15_05675 [Rhizobiales bacterium 32-66-8]|nr:MAG: hypothetical protein B7Z15_05675 [Rhizobiales bacterium 32-66-8]